MQLGQATDKSFAKLHTQILFKIHKSCVAGTSRYSLNPTKVSFLCSVVNTARFYLKRNENAHVNERIILLLPTQAVDLFVS